MGRGLQSCRVGRTEATDLAPTCCVDRRHGLQLWGLHTFSPGGGVGTVIGLLWTDCEEGKLSPWE